MGLWVIWSPFVVSLRSSSKYWSLVWVSSSVVAVLAWLLIQLLAESCPGAAASHLLALATRSSIFCLCQSCSWVALQKAWIAPPWISSAPHVSVLSVKTLAANASLQWNHWSGIYCRQHWCLDWRSPSSGPDGGEMLVLWTPGGWRTSFTLSPPSDSVFLSSLFFTVFRGRRRSTDKRPKLFLYNLTKPWNVLPLRTTRGRMHREKLFCWLQWLKNQTLDQK